MERDDDEWPQGCAERDQQSSPQSLTGRKINVRKDSLHPSTEEGPKFCDFFFLYRHNFHSFFFLSGFFSLNFGGVFEGRVHQMHTFGPEPKSNWPKSNWPKSSVLA